MYFTIVYKNYISKIVNPNCTQIVPKLNPNCSILSATCILYQNFTQIVSKRHKMSVLNFLRKDVWSWSVWKFRDGTSCRKLVRGSTLFPQHKGEVDAAKLGRSVIFFPENSVSSYLVIPLKYSITSPGTNRIN